MRAVVLLVSLAVWGQVDAPPLAYVRDGEGRLTPIHGLAGNFIAGRAAEGPVLLAYSNDGKVEWRLETGRLVAVRNGGTAVWATEATGAVFRGTVAVLAGTGETLRLTAEDTIEIFAGELTSEVAGRAVQWEEGKLRVVQADGAAEEVDCAREPDAISAAAAEWAHVEIDGRAYLLRLTRGRVRLYVLPLGGGR